MKPRLRAEELTGMISLLRDKLVRSENLRRCCFVPMRRNSETKENKRESKECESKDVDGEDENEEGDKNIDGEDDDDEVDRKKDGRKNAGTKEYESEDSEGLKEESKHHRTTMDESNQGIDTFHGNLRKIEEMTRKEKDNVEEDVDMKGEEGVNVEDAISDEDEFKLGTTIEHMRSRSISHVDGESIPDRVNLIDLLYNEGCISFRHKQQIEQQPTQQLQNIEMFQLIKNGNIKTLKLANDYFIRTGQRNVFEMFNQKYCSGGKIINMLKHRGSRYVCPFLVYKIIVVVQYNNCSRQ